MTRLSRRAGRAQRTGVDRVEYAYLRRLLADHDRRVFGLAATATGSVLLDREGLEAFRQRTDGEQLWGRADLPGLMSRRLPHARRKAESDLRRLAFALAPGPATARLLRRRLPPGTVYLNVGHSNLTRRVLEAVHGLPQGHSVVLIHDTIPLDWPEHQKTGTPDHFEERLRAVAASADLVVTPSEQTRQSAENHFERYGRTPRTIVAPLGIEPAPVQPGPVPAGVPQDRPYFVCVGTIEPRKNHTLLLDVWEAFHAERPEDQIPVLVIAGRRGWRNEAVFARLDSLPFIGRTVLEYPDLNDAALGGLIAGARALLQPSLAEGFGLPPYEAARLGVPSVCSELLVFREGLGDAPVYADPTDLYQWKNAIDELAADGSSLHAGLLRALATIRLPEWSDHFSVVLKALCYR